jgi:hypothetical protein
MKKSSALRTYLTALLFLLFACGFAMAQASPAQTLPEKSLDQKIDEWFGKVTGPFVNMIFYPIATEIDAEKVAKMPENLTLSAPGSADMWYYRADDQSVWQRLNVTKVGGGLYCAELGMAEKPDGSTIPFSGQWTKHFKLFL